MSTYYVAIDEQVEGPYGITEMEKLAAIGRIRGNTQISEASVPDLWMPWSDIQAEAKPIARQVKVNGRDVTLRQIPEPASVPAVSVQASRSFVSLPDIRDDLRKGSAYPILRSGLIVLLVFAGIAFVISLIALTDPDSRISGIAGIIASLGSMFSTLILGVLLDIADATLRKVE